MKKPSYLFAFSLACSLLTPLSADASDKDSEESIRYLFKPTPTQIEQAKKLVGLQLKDPNSAQYRNFYITTPAHDTTQIALCGEVNAKNSMGGYTGFTPFFVDNTNGAVIWKSNRRQSIDNDLIQLICFTGITQPPQANQ